MTAKPTQPILSARPRLQPTATPSTEAQAYMEEARALGTPHPDVYRILDHTPELMRTFHDHWRAQFDHGIVPRPLKELARRKIANLRDCTTCNSVKVEAGSIEEKLAESFRWRTSTRLDKREKATMWLIDLLTGFDNDADGCYEALSQHFTTAETVELGWFISFNAGTIPFVRSWRLHESDAKAGPD